MGDWEQPPLFDFSDPGKPSQARPAPAAKSTLIDDKLALIADHHAVVIDMIELTMNLIESRRPMSARDRQRWNRLADRLMEHNSPVIVFLVRLVAELAVQSGVDQQQMLKTLRQKAGQRLDDADRKLRAGGYET
jgi:hypothetical protein